MLSRLALALAAFLPACAEPMVGPPLPGGGPRLEPTLSSISQLIFTPRCLACHSGGVAPDLTEAATPGSLVLQPSSAGDLSLVAPGLPQESSLWVVVAPGAITPMPPGDPLSDAEVQAIFDWIYNGAQDD